MTIAPDERRADRERLLLELLRRLPADACYDEFDFRVDEFPEVQLTSSWRDLEASGWIERVRISGVPQFTLTSAGWLAAMQASGEFASDTTRERCARTMAVLKAAADAAEPFADGWFDWNRDTPSTLPRGWVYNVIRSGLLAALFSQHDINAWLDPRERFTMVRVPATFGRKIV